jgi:hypothetical protein
MAALNKNADVRRDEWRAAERVEHAGEIRSLDGQ